MKYDLFVKIGSSIGKFISFLLQFKFIFRIYNFIYESSSYLFIRLFVKFIELPDRDNKWLIFLPNGKKILTKIKKGDLMSRQFALSYKWHSPALNFTETLLNEYFNKEIPWIDVGSNLGIRSLLALSEGKQVYFIEPNKETNRLNIERCKLNGFNNYSLFEVGASDRKGSTEFTIDKSSYNSSLESGLVSDNEIDRKEIIKIDTLDNLFDNKLNDFKTACIKIDVEGHELQVLYGAERFISRLTPTIIIEVNQKDSHFLEFESLLYQYNYVIFEIGNFKKGKFFKKLTKDLSIEKTLIINNDFLVTADNSLVNKIEDYAI